MDKAILRAVVQESVVRASVVVSSDRFNLHGGKQRKSSTALLLIDVINDMDFLGGEKLARQALPMAKRVAILKARAKAAGVAVIYVNDNFGQWQSDFRKQ